MDSTDSVLFAESPFLDLGLPKRRSKLDPVAAVTGELAKLDKPPGQVADEIIAEIDSLHEPRYMDGYPKLMCAECWTEWPCGTHKAIHGEDRDNCVHSI